MSSKDCTVKIDSNLLQQSPSQCCEQQFKALELIEEELTPSY
jgi:hypothetical protein